MAKNRRQRLARGIEHVLATAEKMHSADAWDVDWLREQLKAAIRVVRETQKVIDIYEESFASDVKTAVKEAMEEARCLQ